MKEKEVALNVDFSHQRIDIVLKAPLLYFLLRKFEEIVSWLQLQERHERI